MLLVKADLNVDRVVGTSSGAYAGSLHCAGYQPHEIAKELCHVPPIRLLRFNFIFWNGFFLLDAVVERLRQILPPTFESLNKPLAVGVVNAKGEHQLLQSGPLPEAIAASGAIPLLFAPVTITGNDQSPFLDGGIRDRTALELWRSTSAQQRGTSLEKPAPAVVHLVARSSFFSGTEDACNVNARRVFLMKSKRSKRSLLGLGDYKQEMIDTYDRLMPSMEKTRDRLLERVRV